MMKLVLLITVTLLCAADLAYSTCTGNACEAISQGNKGIVIRADDGDYFIPQIDTSNYNCSNHSALCFGEGCRMCKCKTQQDTWKDSHGACKNINSGYYVFSREGLEIDTAISTVYFVLNSNGMYELQSVAAGVPLHIVRNSNGDDMASNCAVYKLYVMTQSGMTEIENDGFSIVTEDSKRYVEISPASLKVQPNNLQGKLIELKVKCGNKKRSLYFKIQGKTQALINNTCYDCQGNFKYLEFLDIPEFPRPTASDSPIHYSQNTLQMSGKDVSSCNDVSNSAYSYQNTSGTCSLVQLPNSNLIYSTQNRVQGRNLELSDSVNSAHWDNMMNDVINITVNCQSNKRFCILFRLTNTTSNCSYGNPCKNGGMWVDKGIGSCVCSCPDGYSGDLCTIVTDPCASTPCCDGATCSNNGNIYQCTCPPGKTGSTCCTDIDYCADSPCCGGATCSNNGNTYQCTCPPGKTGSTCCTDIDYCADSPCCGEATCSNNGNTYQCTCPPGKTGSTCCNDIDYCADSPCCGEATCTSNSSLLTFECTCPPGKTGSTCCTDIDYCADSPCCGEATCTSNSSLLTFECTCPPGKTGSTCCTDIDYCADSPCCGEATCTSNSSLLTFECTCPPGKTGSTCCTDIDYCADSPCCGGATCTSNSSLLTFKCTCPPGKTGSTCCNDIDYCADSPCCGEATCTSNSSLLTFECTCPPGKTGSTCCNDIDYCADSPCCVEATCTSNSSLLTFKCTCPPGKTGSTCCNDIDYCADSPCCGEATCTSNSSLLTFECTCPPGKTGSTCCTDIDYCADSPCCGEATCTSNSSLLTFKCTCPPGKTGSTCCTDIDYCADSPCCGGATCSNNGNTYQCTCPPGKTGSTCCTDIDFCDPNPCCNGARCEFDESFRVKCGVCPKGYTGDRCCDSIPDDNGDDDDDDDDDGDEKCRENTCANGGTCRILEGQAVCDCPTVYTGRYCQERVTTSSTVVIAVPTGESANAETGGDSNSANSRMPIIVAIATASVLLLVAVIIIVITIYQRVYVPWRDRTRLARVTAIDPFKDSSHQIYNPMYIDENMAIYSDKSLPDSVRRHNSKTSTNSGSSGSAPDIKHIENPMYTENELPDTAPENDDHIYETSLSFPPLPPPPIETDDDANPFNPYDTLPESIGPDTYDRLDASQIVDDPVYEAINATKTNV